MSTLILRVIAFSVGLLSWRQSQKLGAALGLFWFHVVRIRRRTVLENLKLALPDHGGSHCDIAREAYCHFGVSALELFKLQRMKTDEITGRVHLKGMEHYETALARGCGVIVVTAHFGNFDLLACSQAARGVPLAIVSRELHRGGVSRFWMETRELSGLKIFPDQGAAKKILKWLRSGKVLGLTVDQRTSARRGGIRCDFMGHSVWTTSAPAALALSSGAALLPIRLERRPDGDHDMIVEPEIEFRIEKKQDNNEILVVTWKINKIIENWVRNRPEHWLWLHRRFKG